MMQPVIRARLGLDDRPAAQPLDRKIVTCDTGRLIADVDRNAVARTQMRKVVSLKSDSVISRAAAGDQRIAVVDFERQHIVVAPVMPVRTGARIQTQIVRRDERQRRRRSKRARISHADIGQRDRDRLRHRTGGACNDRDGKSRLACRYIAGQLAAGEREAVRQRPRRRIGDPLSGA